jgi:hypothetical protein
MGKKRRDCEGIGVGWAHRGCWAWLYCPIGHGTATRGGQVGKREREVGEEKEIVCDYVSRQRVELLDIRTVTASNVASYPTTRDRDEPTRANCLLMRFLSSPAPQLSDSGLVSTRFDS